MRRLSPPAPLAALIAGLALGLPAAAEMPLAVQTVTATRSPATQHIELSGTIEAAEAVPVGFRNGGRIEAVLVEVGDQVSRGAPLARLEPTQERAAERAAAAQFGAAEAQLTQATQARERAAGLNESGYATQAALDAAIEAELSARAARDQAQAQMEKARQAVSDTEILAPAAGIVTARAAEPGQIVGAAQTVLTLARDGAREAVFHLPDFPGLDAFLGRRVMLHAVEGDPTEFAATVREIAPMATAATGTVRVKGRLDDPAAGPGLGAAVVSSVDLPLEPAITLPWTALVSDDGAPAVWRVDPASHAVSLSPVTLLRYTDRGIEVAGLAEGTQVVASGAHLLYPGRVVTAVEGGK